MTETKSFTLTVREVLTGLGAMVEAFEGMSAGRSPTGNYVIPMGSTQAAATLKAAQQLILQLPAWIPVTERHPPVGGEDVLVAHGPWDDGGYSLDMGWWNGKEWMFYTSKYDMPPVALWMPLPAVEE